MDHSLKVKLYVLVPFVVIGGIIGALALFNSDAPSGAQLSGNEPIRGKVAVQNAPCAAAPDPKKGIRTQLEIIAAQADQSTRLQAYRCLCQLTEAPASNRLLLRLDSGNDYLTLQQFAENPGFRSVQIEEVEYEEREGRVVSIKAVARPSQSEAPRVAESVGGGQRLPSLFQGTMHGKRGRIQLESIRQNGDEIQFTFNILGTSSRGRGLSGRIQLQSKIATLETLGEGRVEWKDGKCVLWLDMENIRLESIN